MVKRISELKAGEEGVITLLEQTDNLTFRLGELGFVPGTKVECIRLASRRGPIIIRLRGYSLTMELQDLQNIWVET